MAQITIGGHAYPLTFDMDAFERIEEELGAVDTLGEAMTGKARVRTVRRLLEILSGGQLPQEIISLKMRPNQMAEAIKAVWAAIGEGMSMETKDGDEDAETDVVLDEIEKKESAAG